MKIKFRELWSQRLHLRKIEDSDLSNIYLGLSNPEVTRYYAVHYDSLESTKSQMSWYRELFENDKGIWWAICSKTDQIFLGAAGLSEIDEDSKKAEIGLWLLPQYWGSGIMKEAIDVILDFSFFTLELERIQGCVESDNTNCIRALHKLKFTHEGSLIEYDSRKEQDIRVEVFVKNHPGN